MICFKGNILTTETGTSSQLTMPNIPTESKFLPLQDGKESDTPFNRRQEISDLEINSGNTPKINSPKPRDTPPTPSVVNKAIFLCDSNGKFLDKRKLFPSGQQFKFFRCPNIEHARAILQDEINQESEHPHLIVIHSGTNDLTTTTPIDDFISDISVLITQASTMFPKSKVIYSTVLPRLSYLIYPCTLCPK